MKKAIIAIVAVLFLCVICCVVMFFAARSIPSIMDMLPQEVQDMVETGMETTGDEDQDNTTDQTGSQDEGTSDEGTYRYDDGETSWEINSEEKTWPSDMPSSVPQFQYGTIESVSKISGGDGTTWSVNYVNVSGNAYAGYKSAVEQAGFSDLFNFETGDGWSVSGTNGDVSLFGVYDETEGRMSLIVTLMQEEK